MINEESKIKLEIVPVPLVSVVLPVYNGEFFLAEAIDSILAQSFTDFELIIIDDGSTDHSLHIMRQYEKCDSRVKIITRENRGLVTTLNESIDMARGLWVARMDQDDIALPHRLERQLDWIESTGADVCGSWIEVFGGRKKSIRKHPVTDEAIKMGLLFGPLLAHPTVMMRTELIRNLRYNIDWEKCEDYDLWERAAQAGWKMTNVPEVLLYYRQHNTQISNKSSSRQNNLTQQISRRYWTKVGDSMNIKGYEAEEVLLLKESSLNNPNMDYVDAVFTELFKQSPKELHSFILDYASGVYLRASAYCPDIIARWSLLTRNYRVDNSIMMKVKLFILHYFHVQPNSRIWLSLRNFYFHLTKK